MEDVMLAEAKLVHQLNKLTTEQLKEYARNLDSNFEPAADIVFEKILHILEIRMQPEDFIKFCDGT